MTFSPVRIALLQRVEAGAGRGALDEQRPPRRDPQRREQAAPDGAEVEDIAPRLLERQVGWDRMQLRRLRDEELRVAAGRRLIALDREVGEHRVAPDHRREQIVGPRIHRDEIADL